MPSKRSKSRKGPSFYHRVVMSLFHLREEEVSRVTLMFLYSLLAIGAFILGRIIRDTLLLTLPKAQGVGRLPILIAISAVAVSASSYLYTRFANRRRRDKMIILINTIFFAALMGIYVLTLLLPKSLLPEMLQLNYVYVEIMGAMQVIQFWTLASELFDPRSAKRSFAIIGGGAVLANLLAFGVRPMVKLLSGALHLLPLLSLMLLLCIVVVYIIGKQNDNALTQQFVSKQLEQKNERIRSRPIHHLNAQTDRLWNNPHLFAIAAVIFITFLTTTIIDYQFKALAANHYHDAVSLSQYFSMFYGLTGVLACVVQFGLANRILEYRGIQFGLMLLPIALLFSSTMLAVAPMFMPVVFAFTVAKGSENVLRYTINDVSVNLLYVPVSSDLRAKAKAFISGMLKPAAIGISAGSILIFRWFGWQPQQLSWLVVVLVSFWLVALGRAHKEYISTLLRSMQKNRLQLDKSNFSLKDETAIKALREVLRGNDTEHILHALELLPHIPHHPWQDVLLNLLEHPLDEIRVKTLQVMASLSRPQELDVYKELLELPQAHIKDKGLDDRLLKLMHHEAPEIRSQAIETRCALLGDDAIHEVSQYLEDESIKVRASTIIGLIQHGGLDGILQAAEPLKALLNHDSPELRQYGAHILGRIGAKNFYLPILSLFEDPELKVRITAIEAAGKIRNPKLLPGLFTQLKERQTAKYALLSLMAYGEALLPTITQLLNAEDEVEICHYYIRLLGSYGNQEAIYALEDYLQQAPEVMKGKILYALQKLLSQHPNLKQNRELHQKLLYVEMKQFYQWWQIQDTLKQEFSNAEVLSDALDECMEQSIERCFGVLGLLYPPRQIQLIYHQFKHGNSRMQSNAIELLDNLLSNETKRCLLPLLEQRELARTAMERFGLNTLSPEEALQEIIRSASPWLLSYLLWTISKNDALSRLPIVWDALSHPDALVRESALWALESLITPQEFQKQLEEMCHDPDDSIVLFVQEKLSQLAPPSTLPAD